MSRQRPVSRRPILLMVYDFGSVSPTRVARAAAGNECDIVFVQAESPHARAMRPVLQRLGPVIDAAVCSESALVAQLRELGPDGILTFSEVELARTARLAQALSLPYQDVAAIEAIVRKDVQRRRLAIAGVERLRHRTITAMSEVAEAVEFVGLPAIIKPVSGVASRNTFAVSTREHCQQGVADLLGGDGRGDALESAVLLEELLPGRPTESPWGDYVGVDCVAHQGDVQPLFVTSKFELAQPYRERGGYGGVSVVEERLLAQAQELACRALRALGIRHGLAGAEIKFTPDGPRVIEVNGRLGGWVDDLAVRSGTADPVDVAIKCALGRDFPPPRLQSGYPIVFNYLVIPPLSARRVASIHNVMALRRLRNVDRVQVSARVGRSVHWRLGSTSGVAGVCGTADDHDELAKTVAEIEDADWIRYE